LNLLLQSWGRTKNRKRQVKGQLFSENSRARKKNPRCREPGKGKKDRYISRDGGRQTKGAVGRGNLFVEKKWLHVIRPEERKEDPPSSEGKEAATLGHINRASRVENHPLVDWKGTAVRIKREKAEK